MELGLTLAMINDNLEDTYPSSPITSQPWMIEWGYE